MAAQNPQGTIPPLSLRCHPKRRPHHFPLPTTPDSQTHTPRHLRPHLADLGHPQIRPRRRRGGEIRLGGILQLHFRTFLITAFVVTTRISSLALLYRIVLFLFVLVPCLFFFVFLAWDGRLTARSLESRPIGAGVPYPPDGTTCT